MSGRKEIFPEEYKVLPNNTFERSMKPCFEEGYVTPFDPRTELRYADFGTFKSEILKMYREGIISNST